jgi:tetratricopeptide (TPR) repeat protein
VDEALAEYKIVADLRPSEILGLIECARIYFQRGQNTLAVQTMQQALEILPEDPLALGTLAVYWIGERNESEAHQYLLRCRMQVRLPKAQLAQLQDAYRATFGHPPW